MKDKEYLDQEILKEIASVGGIQGEQIEKLMARMKRISRIYRYLVKRIERSSRPQPLSLRTAVTLRKEFLSLREKAIEKRKNLIIYREALGLLRHREVFEIYDIESIRLNGENS